MKRLWAGLLAACLLLSLAACGGGEEDVETAWTPLQMARAILESQEAPPGMTELLPGDGTYEIYVADSYGLNPEDVADGAILAAGGASAQEIAVLRLTEQADSDKAADALRAYLEARAGDFTGYLPEEAALLDGAGQWTILVRIFLPLATPALATIAVYCSLAQWNEWFNGIIYMKTPSQYPLMSYLQATVLNVDMESLSAEEQMKMASIGTDTYQAAQLFIAALPMLCIYPFMQKYFTKGLVMGSVKG